MPRKSHLRYYYRIGGMVVEQTEPKTEQEKVIKQAIEAFKKAIEENEADESAFNGWGDALRCLAEIKAGKIKEGLLNKAIDKYEQAININQESYKAYDCLGDTLIKIVTLKKGKNKAKLLSRAFDMLMKAEEIKEGEGSYNLACVFSLNGEKEKTLEWLEKSLKMETAPPLKQILEDTDLTSIRGSKKLKRLLDKYHPPKE